MKDWDTMIAVGDITHYLGDAICLVAAETPEILAQAKALVKVDYEELPMVRSPREAMLPDAPLVHRTGNLLTHKHIQRGNPAEAIAKSKHVLTQHFSTPWTEHAFLEPECAVAYPDGDGVMILSTDQPGYIPRIFSGKHNASESSNDARFEVYRHNFFPTQQESLSNRISRNKHPLPESLSLNPDHNAGTNIP